MARLRQLRDELEADPFDDDDLQRFALTSLVNLADALERFEPAAASAAVNALAYAEKASPTKLRRLRTGLAWGFAGLSLFADSAQVYQFVADRYSKETTQVCFELDQLPMLTDGSGGETVPPQLGVGEAPEPEPVETSDQSEPVESADDDQTGVQ